MVITLEAVRVCDLPQVGGRLVNLTLLLLVGVGHLQFEALDIGYNQGTLWV